MRALKAQARLPTRLCHRTVSEKPHETPPQHDAASHHHVCRDVGGNVAGNTFWMLTVFGAQTPASSGPPEATQVWPFDGGGGNTMQASLYFMSRFNYSGNLEFQGGGGNRASPLQLGSILMQQQQSNLGILAALNSYSRNNHLNINYENLKQQTQATESNDDDGQNASQ